VILEFVERVIFASYERRLRNFPSGHYKSDFDLEISKKQRRKVEKILKGNS